MPHDGATGIDGSWPLFFRVLLRFQELKSVSRACKEVGLSRSSYYFLKDRFEAGELVVYRAAGARKRPKSGATRPETLEELLELTRRYPTYSCKRIATLLRARGRKISATTIRNFWLRQGLATQAHRLRWLRAEAQAGRAELTVLHRRLLEKLE